ncbi:hypothetical protein ACHAQH_006285 [Verticillium albo-atrum]
MAPNSVRSVDVSAHDTISSTTRNASTLAELISTIPQTWRPALGVRITAVYRVATKLCNVQNTIAQYERHVAEGSYPAPVRNSIKDPKIQFSKEFLSTEDGSLVAGTIATEILNARKALLACALARKKEELAALQKATAWDPVAWRNVIAEVAQRVAATMGCTVAGDASKDPVPVWKGAVATGVQEDCKTLWNNGSHYHYRTIGIARSISDKSVLEKVKTLTLKNETDVSMRDADTDQSTRQVVRDEIKAEMANLKKDMAKMMNISKKPAQRKKGGSNNTFGRVTKGNPNQKKGQNKKRG